MKWIILLLSVLCAQAQQPFIIGMMSQQQAATASPFNNVTNLAGYPVSAFYVPTLAYVTNSSPNYVQLTDLWTNAWHLTNEGAASSWPVRQIAALNNHDTVLFDGSSCYLESVNFQIAQSSASFEIILVARYDNVASGGSAYFWDLPGNPTATRMKKHSDQTLVTTINNGTDVVAGFVTNKWMVWDVVAPLAGNTSVYTNNVLAVSGGGSASPTTAGGLMVGAFAPVPGTLFSRINVAAIVTFTNAIPGTNSTARASVFSALTNYFNISP